MALYIPTNDARKQEFERILPSVKCDRFINLMKFNVEEPGFEGSIDQKIADVISKVPRIWESIHFTKLVMIRLVNIIGHGGNWENVQTYVNDLLDYMQLNSHVPENLLSVCVSGIACAECFVKQMSEILGYAAFKSGITPMMVSSTKGPRPDSVEVDEVGLVGEVDDLEPVMNDNEILETILNMFITVVVHINTYIGMRKLIIPLLAEVDICEESFETPMKKKAMQTWLHLMRKYRNGQVIRTLFWKPYANCWLRFYCPPLEEYNSKAYADGETPFFKILDAVNKGFNHEDNKDFSSERADFLSLLIQEYSSHLCSQFHADNEVLITLCRDILHCDGVCSVSPFNGMDIKSKKRLQRNIHNFLAASSLGVKELDAMQHYSGTPTGPTVYCAAPGTTNEHFIRRFRSVSFDNLTVLDASHTQLLTSCAEMISKFPNLRSLCLRGTHFNNLGVARLAEGCRNLRLLDLTDCNITDRCISNLLKLKNLDFLFLKGTKITREGFEYLEDRLALTMVNNTNEAATFYRAIRRMDVGIYEDDLLCDNDMGIFYG